MIQADEARQLSKPRNTPTGIDREVQQVLYNIEAAVRLACAEQKRAIVYEWVKCDFDSAFKLSERVRKELILAGFSVKVDDIRQRCGNFPIELEIQW